MSPNSSPLLKSAATFAALGDETRIRIVSRLSSEGPLSITALTEGTQVTRQAITKHLAILADARLVQGHRHGRERIWELEKKRLEIAQRFLDQVSQRWDAALEHLQKLVEAGE